MIRHRTFTLTTPCRITSHAGEAITITPRTPLSLEERVRLLEAQLAALREEKARG